jgi:hypothetical protein
MQKNNVKTFIMDITKQIHAKKKLNCQPNLLKMYLSDTIVEILKLLCKTVTDSKNNNEKQTNLELLNSNILYLLSLDWTLKDTDQRLIRSGIILPAICCGHASIVNAILKTGIIHSKYWISTLRVAAAFGKKQLYKSILNSLKNNCTKNCKHVDNSWSLDNEDFNSSKIKKLIANNFRQLFLTPHLHSQETIPAFVFQLQNLGASGQCDNNLSDCCQNHWHKNESLWKITDLRGFSKTKPPTSVAWTQYLERWSVWRDLVPYSFLKNKKNSVSHQLLANQQKKIFQQLLNFRDLFNYYAPLACSNDQKLILEIYFTEFVDNSTHNITHAKRHDGSLDESYFKINLKKPETQTTTKKIIIGKTLLKRQHGWQCFGIEAWLQTYENIIFNTLTKTFYLPNVLIPMITMHLGFGTIVME